MKKNQISSGSLVGAVVLGAVAAFLALSNMSVPEFWMYTYMATFWVFLFLHWFFRDKSFDKLQAINTTIWILLPWCPILILYAFMLGEYVAMFVSLGFFIIFYLFHLLVSIAKSDR